MSHATRLRRLASRLAHEAASQDVETRRLLWADAAAIRAVATRLEAGDVEGAQAALDGLDTAPRERVLDALDA